MTQTTIVVDRVKLIGLDSFTRFDPFEMPTGKYTLQTGMAWEYLALEIDATVTIRPSTLDDSIIVDSAGTTCCGESQCLCWHHRFSCKHSTIDSNR